MASVPASTPAIACSRMYNTGPVVRDLWTAFFGQLAKNAAIDLDVIEHKAPAPLGELWARPDMGAVFMCGYPFSLRDRAERPVPLASPVPLSDWAPWAGGKAVYASHIVAASDRVLTVDDLATACWGWTVRDSQSGYNAPREFFATLPGADAANVKIDGPLLNPGGVVDALHDGRIDVGALDAYAYYLMARYEPEKVAGLQVVATTRPAPFPLLVAAATQAPEIITKIRDALLSFHDTEGGQAMLAGLGLSRFDAPDLAALEQLPARKASTDTLLGGVW